MEFLTAKEVSRITGINLRKAQDVVRIAAKEGVNRGGIYVRGKAPRRILEELLLCDLSGKGNGGNNERN